MKISHVIGGIAFLLGLAWLFQGNDFFLYKAFAPKYEQVRRETFEESKAFNQGMIQELQNMQFEYVKAAPEHKAALASIILHRAADFDLEQPQVPTDLRVFIVDLRKQRSVSR
jgi:hypothetical protein